MNAEEIAALVAAAVVRTEKEAGFVQQMHGKTKCSPKQLHWLRGLAARAEGKPDAGEPAPRDVPNVVAFPGYLCRNGGVFHACIAYANVHAFAQSNRERRAHHRTSSATGRGRDRF